MLPPFNFAMVQNIPSTTGIGPQKPIGRRKLLTMSAHRFHCGFGNRQSQMRDCSVRGKEWDFEPPVGLIQRWVWSQMP
jgi:hypothetical protein